MSWPQKLFVGTPRDWALTHLEMQRRQMIAKPDDLTEMRYPDQKWLMGYALPPFQRPLLWDTERMVRFCESAILGLHLGTWVYNVADHITEIVQGREVFHRTDHWLIDGQQRLTALDRFFGDEFPVFGWRWSEAPLVDQRRFLNRTMFTAYETRITDEATLRQLYDRLNFGGIAHTPDQRAVREDDAALPTSAPRT